MLNYLIIGASSGIGNSLAHKLAQSGHQVFGTYNTQKPTQESKWIRYHALNVLDQNMDLSFLPETLDGMIYCPGSILLKPFERIKDEDFLEDYKLQIMGAIKVLKNVLQKLKKSDNASILFFSSVAAQMGLNYHTQVSITKGAIEGLTISLAAELAPKVRVNCIAPSLVDTPLAANLLNSEQKKEANAQRHPLKRIGSVDDISDMAEFLLSEKSSWITGQIIRVDGGISKLKI